MKVAPLIRAMRRHENLVPILIHTGQHYDENMSQLFFEELELPAPDYHLGVGSGSHAFQTAEIMKRVEPVLIDEKPDLVVVVGDVNSTIACALVAKKLLIRVAHVEAGLRSRDWTMPEEINRILTDAIADLLFVTEEAGRENLLNEGIDESRIYFVGNVMIDTLRQAQKAADSSDILEKLSLNPGDYAVLTLHRPSNVDDPEKFAAVLGILNEVQNRIPLVFPIHPRTRASLKKKGYEARIESMPNLILVDPLGYLDFLWLMSNARVVLTDSGGIQEETTVLQVPCLTMRENTERPVTAAMGTNTLVGTDRQKLLDALDKAMTGSTSGTIPPLWDGTAAERIAEIIAKEAEARESPNQD